MTNGMTGGVTDAAAPFCVHLCSKKSFFLERPARDKKELLDGSQACWCARTMIALGPDGGLVDPEDCRAGRACFVPVFGATP